MHKTFVNTWLHAKRWKPYVSDYRSAVKLIYRVKTFVPIFSRNIYRVVSEPGHAFARRHPKMIVPILIRVCMRTRLQSQSTCYMANNKHYLERENKQRKEHLQSVDKVFTYYSIRGFVFYLIKHYILPTDHWLMFCFGIEKTRTTTKVTAVSQGGATKKYPWY